MFFQNALIFGNAFSELNPLMNNIISNEDFIQLSLINGLIRNSLEKNVSFFLMKIQSKYGDAKQNGIRLLRTFIIAENDTKIFFN